MRRREVLAGVVAAACGSSRACRLALAQSKRLPLVAYLSIGPNLSFPQHRSALAALGWEDGKNVRLETHSGDGQIEGLRSVLGQLLRQQPDVIVAAGGTVTLHTAAITRTIPIVMSASSTDPVRAGWAESYARPGGNVTGLTFANDEVVEKQLQLLKQTAPNLTHVGILHTPGNEAVAWIAERAFQAAAALGLARTLAQLGGLDEVEGVLEGLRAVGADAVLVIADPIIDNLRSRIADAAGARLMASAGQLEFYAASGFLVTYAPQQNAIYRRAAVFIDQILRGARPADLPIERPTKYIFTINAGPARKLGLMVSPAVLSVADEVIE